MPAKLFQQSEVDAMYAPFPLEEHSIRQGYSAFGKTRWFVYLERETIQRYLDKLFPFEWEVIPGPVQSIGKGGYTATCTIRIRGLERGFNGAQSEMNDDENTPKGAMTDAFRRAASLWGVGSYLWSSEDIWTPEVTKEMKPDQKRAIRDQAVKSFADWYKKKFGNISDMEQKRKEREAEQGEQRVSGDSVTTPSPSAPPLSTDKAPNTVIVQLMQRDEVSQHKAHPVEKQNTIHALWREGALADMDIEKRAKVLIARLDTHKDGAS